MSETRTDHEDLLQLLYSVPVGLVHAAADGRIALINSAAARWLLPLAPDGRLDNLYTVLSMVAPGLRSHVAATPAARQVVEPDLRLVVDGGPRAGPQHVSVTLSRLGEGHLMAVVNDVTRQVRDEQAIDEGQAHYRAVIAVLGEGILVHDPGGRVLLANAAAERMLGATAAAWGHDAWLAPGWSLLGADGQPLAAADTPTGRVLRGEPVVDMVLIEAAAPDARRHWFEIRAQPVRSPGSGALLAVVTSFSDVTQRQRMDEQLARHREQLEALVAERTAQLEESNARLDARQRQLRSVTDAVPDLIGHWGRDLRCRFANSAHAGWFGRRADDLVGIALEDLLGPAAFRAIQPEVEAVLRGEGRHFQHTLHRVDGGARHTLATLIPEMAAGEVTGFNMVVSDVSVLKQAELQLQALNAELAERAAQADAATRAKGAFLATMSHEIRTPMNAILGLTQLMGRDAHDPLQRERLGKVDHAARHLLAVINDILDLSKIGAGKMVLHTADFDTGPLLERAFEMVADEAADKGLETVLDAGALPPRLHGDALRLSQALINLLANAVKFTPSGWVRLRARVMEEAPRGLRVRFEVEDTGPGVDPAHRPRLFTAFEQGDAELTQRHGGTGLGLALTRHIAELMDGEAGMHDAPAGGSVFWFTAWLAHVGPADGEASQALDGRRVLLVSSLPVAREACTTTLEGLGLQVDAVADAATALARLEAARARGPRPDLLVVDRQLADGDGIELLREAARRLGDAVPPALVRLRGQETVPDAGAAAPARIGAWLGKPAAPATLRRIVAAVIATAGAPVDSPATPAIAGIGSSEQQLRASHAGRRVLVVEDNPINRELAVELLLSVGLVAETAVNGREAVARLQAAPAIDLVLMDMQMPVMNGLDATREIRRLLGPRMPILAMTANAFDDDRAACLGAGMNDHLPKPIDTTRLYAALLHWMPPLPAPGAAPAAAAAPAAPAAVDLRERLAAFGEIDLAQGLRHTAGRIDLLERALRRFVARYADGEPALATGDTAAWRHASHSIRGAGGTIGAERLVAQVSAFEAALAAADAGTTSAAAAREIDQALRRLVAGLQRCLAP